MKFVFLDFDGVLNDLTMMPNKYPGIQYDKVELLNKILKEEDVFLVISSSWRYLCINGLMTMKGFEHMLLSHGINCKDKVHGLTEWDEKYWSSNPTSDDWKDLTVRSRQIADYNQKHNPESFVVFDDLDLPVANLVRTNGKLGLQQQDIDKALQILFG